MNFEARKAEILRRSKTRIQRRRRIRLLCVPLALCAVLGGLYLWQPDVPEYVVRDSLSDTEAAVHTEAAMEQVLTGTVQVSAEGVFLLHEDATQVSQILQLLSQIQETQLLLQESIGRDSQSTDQKQTGYRLLITDAQSIRTEYLLTDTQLENLTEETLHPLNATQRQALYEALCLPIS